MQGDDCGLCARERETEEGARARTHAHTGARVHTHARTHAHTHLEFLVDLLVLERRLGHLFHELDLLHTAHNVMRHTRPTHRSTSHTHTHT